MWPALLKPKEAAAYLSVCEKTLDRLRAAGKIKTVAWTMPGSDKPMVRYRLSDLDAFAESLKYGEGVAPCQS